MTQSQPGGLFVGTERVPLRGVSVRVKVQRTAAEVVVAQRYVNTEKVPVEAVYSFPLPESAAVCRFEALIGGKRIVGRVEEREAAFEQYDAAMAAGHGAFLVDQDRPNIFTASVGNLLPGQEVVIELAYATELEQTGDQIRLLIPTTISPRYIPREQFATMDPAELDHLLPPTAMGGVPYGLTLTVDVDAAAGIKEVACPSHPIEVRIDGAKARLELLGADVQLDQDFVANIRLAEPHRAAAIVADDDGSAVVMLNVFPELGQLPRGPSEVVFLLDRSGSMDGDSISQARSALQLCLRSLAAGDYFNIVGFGSRFEALFPTSRPYNQTSLDEATAHVAGLGADLGGTELLAPLEHVLGAAPIAGLRRQLVLLTDGEVGNETECIAAAQRRAAHCRVFTFGIGRGASEFLVRGLARAGRGEAEFIHPNERIEPKVLRQFARLASGSVQNVRVDWGDLRPNLIAPVEPASLFAGDRFTIYARVPNLLATEIAVLADGPGGPIRLPIRINSEPRSESRAVTALFARKAIQELEESPAVVRGSAQHNRKESSARHRIRELALRYQILSSETSFVAMEERPEGQALSAELRRIPIALTRGWGGVDLYASASDPYGHQTCFSMDSTCRSTDMSDSAAMLEFVDRDESPPKDLGLSLAQRAIEGIRKSMPAFVRQGATKHENPASPPPDALDPLIQLALVQQADGRFTLTPALADAVGVPLSQLQEAARKLSGPAGETIVATVTALVILEERFANRRDEWQLLAAKAQQWLQSQTAAPPSPYRDWSEWGRQLTTMAGPK